GSRVEEMLAYAFATKGTDWAVNPLLARGFRSDGNALIQGSASIVVNNIDHFGTRHHSLMNRLHEILLQLMVSGEFHHADVEVNGTRMKRKLVDYSPKEPLILNAYGGELYDVVRFGHMNPIGRYIRRFYAVNMLRA